MSSKHCRICYKLDQDDLISVRLKQDGISIEEMILTITNISVSGDRRLPQNICLQCLDRLKEAFELRQLCIRTHERLSAELEADKDVIIPENEPIKPEPDDVTIDEASVIIEKLEIDTLGEGVLNLTSEQSGQHYEAIEEVVCCGCAMRFSTRYELEKHAKVQHRNGKAKPDDAFHCSTCYQSFPDQVMLNRHLEEISQMNTLTEEELEFTDEDEVDEEEKQKEEEEDEEEEEEDEANESDQDREDWEEQTNKKLKQAAIIQSAICRIPGKNLLIKSDESQGYLIVELQPYRCCCCAELFQTEQDRNEHLKERMGSNEGASDSGAKYTCEYCGKRFAYWLVYLCHKRVRDQRQFYMCGLCETLLDSKKRMISHMLMSDEHADYFKLSRANIADQYEAIALPGVRCCCCKQYFEDEAQRKEHMARLHRCFMKTAVSKLPNSCSLCNRKFRTKRHLELHLQYTRDVTQYYCKLCSFETYNPRRLELHLYSGIHRDKLPTTTVQLKPLQNSLLNASRLRYCCFEHCHKPFPDGSALEQHINEAHESALTANRKQTEKLTHLLEQCEGTYHACNDCGVLFKNLTALQTHRSRRQPRQAFVCTICGVSKASRALLRNHERSHSAERPYRCADCEKTFSSNPALLSHRRCHLTGTHKCDTCGNVFNRKENLNRHILLKHGIATIPCEDCSKLFKTIHALNRHKIRHTGEKRYACRKSESCTKRYANEVDRRRHEMSVHTLERPHQCAHCGAGFVRKRQLTVHERRHTGVKPYACTVCGKEFVDAGPLRNHMRTVCKLQVIGKEGMECDL